MPPRNETSSMISTDSVELEKALPTSELELKLQGLPEGAIRQAGPIPPASFFIIVTELAERFAFYGASLLFQVYMLEALKLDKGTATAVNRGFQFFCYFTAVFGAIVADVWLGKFRTVMLFSLVYMIGLILLSVSALPFSLEGGFGVAGFIVSTYVFIATGTGGIKANVSAFAAEQVKPGVVPSGRPNIYYDSDITVESVFRYFYWGINVGALLGMGICPIVFKSNHALAFGIPAIVFVIGIVVFILGRNKYVASKPSGTVLVKTWRCLTYAFKNRKAGAPYWLDNAKVEGKMWDNQFVDDLRRTLQACKVFLFYPVFWSLYASMSDLFINMGINMDRPSWLGPEQLNLVNSLVLVAAIPLFDYTIFPVLRKMGFRLGPIARITTGFVICTLAFVYVTVLQSMLYNTGPWYNFEDLTGLPAGAIPINDISIWWQVPPYVIIAISEIFSSATGLEFAFSQAPKELKSIVMSLFLLTNCGGSLIGMALAYWSKDPWLVNVFSIQTVALGLTTVLFYWMFRHLDNETSDK